MTPRHMENTCLAFLHGCREAAYGTSRARDKQVPEASRSQLKQPDAPARGTWLSLLLKTLEQRQARCRLWRYGRALPRCHFVLPLWTLGMEGLR